jgi:hypothetical protein
LLSVADVDSSDTTDRLYNEYRLKQERREEYARVSAFVGSFNIAPGLS